MKLIIISLLFFSGISAYALENYTCTGVNQAGKRVVIQYDEWVDRDDGILADVTVEVDGHLVESAQGLSVYLGNEDGFDLGVTETSGKWMFHIIFPPNMFGNEEIAARYYPERDFSIKNSVVLMCSPGLDI
ncbi:MAG: hypothetical protein KDD34_01900 [Bdellovibrionales bacterium]|nr:hypothetical protein [Bdellovibrionales bacterium]